MTNEYYSLRDEYENDIRRDIAKEFGLEAAGYAPRPKHSLTPRQAQRLYWKYGKEQAMVIANRYIALKTLAQ